MKIIRADIEVLCLAVENYCWAMATGTKAEATACAITRKEAEELLVAHIHDYVERQRYYWILTGVDIAKTVAKGDL